MNTFLSLGNSRVGTKQCRIDTEIGTLSRHKKIKKASERPREKVCTEVPAATVANQGKLHTVDEGSHSRLKVNSANYDPIEAVAEPTIEGVIIGCNEEQKFVTKFSKFRMQALEQLSTYSCLAHVAAAKRTAPHCVASYAVQMHHFHVRWGMASDCLQDSVPI